ANADMYERRAAGGAESLVCQIRAWQQPRLDVVARKKSWIVDPAAGTEARRLLRRVHEGVEIVGADVARGAMGEHKFRTFLPHSGDLVCSGEAAFTKRA